MVESAKFIYDPAQNGYNKNLKDDMQCQITILSDETIVLNVTTAKNSMQPYTEAFTFRDVLGSQINETNHCLVRVNLFHKLYEGLEGN